MRTTAKNPMNLTKSIIKFEIFEQNQYLCICRTDFLAIFTEKQKPRSPHPFQLFRSGFCASPTFEEQHNAIFPKEVSPGCVCGKIGG